MQSDPYRGDIKLFFLLIPFISAFNYYLTYPNISLNGFLVLTYTIDTVQGLLAWWCVRHIILLFDKKLPYEANFSKRLTYQIILTTGFGLFIIAVTTEMISWIAKGKGAPIKFYTEDLFIIGIWFLVINGIYTGSYYYNLWKAATLPKLNNPACLIVKHGKQELKIMHNDLEGIYVEDEFVIALCRNRKKYFLDLSLDKLEKQLSNNTFFRLNRQYLLHRQSIAGFKKAENGKLQVVPEVNVHFPDDIIVSRTKAPAFKTWFRMNTYISG